MPLPSFIWIEKPSKQFFFFFNESGCYIIEIKYILIKEYIIKLLMYYRSWDLVVQLIPLDVFKEDVHSLNPPPQL